MSYIKNLECTLCHEVYEDKKLNTCPVCGEKGILEINYDYNKIQKVFSKKILQKNKQTNIFRYLPLLPLDNEPKDTLEVGWTPLYHSKNLGEKLQMPNLFFKDEGVNPTSSLKDRASVIACLKAKEEGFKIVSCSSTGNAASSLAGNASKLGLDSIIFVPKRAPLGKLSQLLAYGAHVIKIDGDYKDTFEASKVVIDKFNLYNRNAAINPNLVEGKKTVAFEIAEQFNFEPIENVVVSVGDGCTIYSVYKGFYDLKQLNIIEKIPRVIGVQAEGCDPFYQAWLNNEDIKETEENTIADSIAVGIPRNPVKGLKAVNETNGFFITVSDKEILDASYLLARNEGIFSEPAGAASFAGLLKSIKKDLINKEDITVVIVTGNGLKDANSLSGTVDKTTNISKDKLIKNISKDKSKKQSLKQIMDKIQNNEVKEHE